MFAQPTCLAEERLTPVLAYSMITPAELVSKYDAITLALQVKVPFFAKLNLLLPPTCKSISLLDALLAVSVTFSLNAVGVPLVFQIPERSNKL